MSGLVRYSSIDTGFRREFLLLQGTGCRWHGCTFCDYHLDRSSDPFEVNREVLAMVSGRYGVLDIIDSGSAMELDERTLALIAHMVRQKNIHDLWFEAHWMYRHQLEAFSSRFDCRVHYRTGIESFNPELRVKWNKGVGRDVTPEDVARYFDGVCLLAGMEGQSADDVMRLDNCNFLERLQNWVQEQNRNGVTLTDAEFISLRASDGGLSEWDENYQYGVYKIQGALIYEKE